MCAVGLLAGVCYASHARGLLHRWALPMLHVNTSHSMTMPVELTPLVRYGPVLVMGVLEQVLILLAAAYMLPYS